MAQPPLSQEGNTLSDATFLTHLNSVPMESILPARTLNHVTISVAGLEESRSFYNRLLGLPLMQQGKTAYNLGPLGASFVSLIEDNPRGVISYFCIGVDNFKADAAAERLRTAGITPEVVRANQVYLRDPDGARIRLESTSYAGSEPVPESQPTPRAPIFSAKRLNSVQVNAVNLSRSQDFYQRVFALSLIRSGENVVVLGVGKDQALSLSGEANRKKGAIEYAGFGIETFAADSAVSRLSTYLPEVNPSDVTDTFMTILDPNGVKLQISGLNYRG